jgi:hypothetical protein
MAINITSLPVGIYMQSGNGVPTHISPKGTEYTDLDTAIVYINKDGVSTWAEFLDSTFVITGGTGSYFTGGTVTGPTNFLNGVTANTISATTYQNLPTDVRVTGGTYSSGTILFTNNTGGTFTVSGFFTGETTSAYFTQSSPSTGWTFTHNLGVDKPLVTVYDATNKVIIPQEVSAISLTTLYITFPVPVAGYVIAAGGVSYEVNNNFFTLMSEAEKNAIVSPNIGLHVYQSDGVEGVWVFKSSGWTFAY